MQPAERRPPVRSYRRGIQLIHAAVLLGLPFLEINGESALRFDVPTLKLHFFGVALWAHEFFFVLVAAVFVTVLAIFATLLFGRVWCGWFCPQTVLVDFTSFLDRAATRGVALRLASYAVTFILTVVVAASLVWYFESPYRFIPALLRGDLGGIVWGFWTVLAIVLFLNLALLRHRWCATVCPYAKLQGVLFDRDTLIIEMDPARSSECIDCRNCLRACPTEVDVRKGLDAACIHCAACIDACDEVMRRSGKSGLVRYALGAGGGGRLLRRNTLVFGGVLLLCLAIMAHLVSARTAVDVTVLPHAMEPRLTKDGQVINAYVLAVQNKLSRPVDLTVTVERFDASMIQSVTGTLRLEADGVDRFPLFVRASRGRGVPGVRKIGITLENAQQNIRISKEANFVIPVGL